MGRWAAHQPIAGCRNASPLCNSIQIADFVPITVFACEYARILTLDATEQGHDPPWRFDPVLSGGGDYPFIFDHACHLFATARLLGPAATGGMVAEVAAMTRKCVVAQLPVEV